MSIPCENDPITSDCLYADRARFCIHMQTNRSISTHLRGYLIGRRFQSMSNGRRLVQNIDLGPRQIPCSIEVYSTFGRKIVAVINASTLTGLRRQSSATCGEVSLSGAENFLASDDLQSDNKWVARAVDEVIAAAHVHVGRIILGMREYQAPNDPANIFRYANLEIEVNSEPVSVAEFEVSYDIASNSPVATVRRLAPQIRELCREPEHQSYAARYGERNSIGGLQVWGRINRDLIVKLYAKTSGRVRVEFLFRKSRVRALAPRCDWRPQSQSLRDGEQFSDRFLRAAQ